MIESDTSSKGLGCTVCYQSKTDLYDSNMAYSLCESCDQPICIDCLESWAKQQLDKRHFKHL